MGRLFITELRINAKSMLYGVLFNFCPDTLCKNRYSKVKDFIYRKDVIMKKIVKKILSPFCVCLMLAIVFMCIGVIRAVNVDPILYNSDIEGFETFEVLAEAEHYKIVYNPINEVYYITDEHCDGATLTLQDEVVEWMLKDLETMSRVEMVSTDDLNAAIVNAVVNTVRKSDHLRVIDPMAFEVKYAGAFTYALIILNFALIMNYVIIVGRGWTRYPVRSTTILIMNVLVPIVQLIIGFTETFMTLSHFFVILLIAICSADLRKDEICSEYQTNNKPIEEGIVAETDNASVT